MASLKSPWGAATWLWDWAHQGQGAQAPSRPAPWSFLVPFPAPTQGSWPRPCIIHTVCCPQCASHRGEAVREETQPSEPQSWLVRSPQPHTETDTGMRRKIRGQSSKVWVAPEPGCQGLSRGISYVVSDAKMRTVAGPWGHPGPAIRPRSRSRGAGLDSLTPVASCCPPPTLPCCVQSPVGSVSLTRSQ